MARIETFENEAKSAEYKRSLSSRRLTTRELEEMKVINDTKPVPAIIGDGSEPVDRNLFNKLILRCRDVNDERH
eukprot:4801133-Heterocapsa_arctica.AAC.1